MFVLCYFLFNLLHILHYISVMSSSSVYRNFEDVAQGFQCGFPRTQKYG